MGAAVAANAHCPQVANMPPPDTYTDYNDLTAHEVEDRDFRIVDRVRSPDVAVVAHHGGGIECGTSELARAIAGRVHSLYLFEGIKPRGNRHLHITSDNFTEPRGLAVVHGCRRVLAIHGEGSPARAVFVGGRDCEWGNVIDATLTAAGFTVREHPKPYLQGNSPANLCNRGTTGEGVQLEIGEGLRQQFFRSLNREGRRHPTELFHHFVAAVQVCLA